MPMSRAMRASRAAAADRGGKGSVVITDVNSGKSVAAMRSTSLSSMMPNTSRRGGAILEAMNGAISSAACALWPPSIQISFPANSTRSSRPRQVVRATPRSMLCGVIFGSSARSSCAACTARAALRS